MTAADSDNPAARSAAAQSGAGPWGCAARDRCCTRSPRASRAPVVRDPAHASRVYATRAVGSGTAGALPQRGGAGARRHVAPAALLAAPQAHRAAGRAAAWAPAGDRAASTSTSSTIGGRQIGWPRRGRRRRGQLCCRTRRCIGAPSCSCRCSRSIRIGAIRVSGVAGRTLLARLARAEPPRASADLLDFAAITCDKLRK